MSKQDTLFDKFGKLRKRLALFTMAGALGVSGCAVQNKEEHKHDEKKVNEIIRQIDEKIIKEKSVDAAESIINDLNSLMPRLKVDGLGKKDLHSLKDLKQEETSIYDTIDLSNSKEASLEDALRLAGYGYSFAFRAELANHFGISDYRGTAAQNIQLLNILKNKQTVTEEVSNKENLDTTINSQTGSQHRDEVDITNTNKENQNNDQLENSDGTISNDKNIVNPGDQINPVPPISAENDHEEDQNHSRPEHGSNNHPNGGNNRPSGGNGSGNTGGSSNNNGGNDHNDSNPEQPPKEHKHKFGVKDYTDDIENLVCSHPNCNETTTRKHELDEGTKNQDGSTTYKCKHEGCNYTKTIVKEEHQHNYIVESYTDDEENLKCSDPNCNETTTRKHELDEGTKNQDGSTTYKCKHEGCNYTKTIAKEEHKHDFIVESYTDDEENLKCSDPNCNETTTRKHELDEGTKNQDGSITYKCKHEGCNYTKTIAKEEEHKHDFIVSDYTDDIENLVCSDPNCNETTTRNHKKVSGSIQDDGSFDLSCENEGCDWTLHQTHIHTTQPHVEIVGTEDVCTKTQQICTVCDEVISVEDVTSHNFRESSGWFGTHYECLVCSYSYDEENDLLDGLLTDKEQEDAEIVLDYLEVLEESESEEEIKENPNVPVVEESEPSEEIKENLNVPVVNENKPSEEIKENLNVPVVNENKPSEEETMAAEVIADNGMVRKLILK